MTQTTATLIDNIFISEKVHRSFDSAVILRDISDHLALLCLVKQAKLLDKSQLEFDSKSLNDNKLCKIKHKLYSVDWVRLLNSESCDENFNKCNAKINEVMDQIAPLKTVSISAKCRYKEPWMSKCIEISSRKNSELYKATLKEGCANKMCERHKNYRNCYNQLKRSAKFNYYKGQVDESKTNSKKLWRVINNVIGKNKNKGSIIPYITDKGVCKYDPSIIAN